MEFLKGFFRENTQESMTRLVYFLSVMSSITICYGTIAFLFVYAKDYTSQAALISGILLSSSTLAKVTQKGKEAPQPKE